MSFPDGMWTMAVLAPAMCLACWSDYRHRRVPNWLTGSLAIGGLAVGTMSGGWNGLSHAMLGLLTGLALLLGPWLIRAMGAGDVKYMAALGAWLGPATTLWAVVAGGLLGGLMASATILMRRQWSATAANVGTVMWKLTSARRALSDFGSVASLSGVNGVMPYAIPLSVGTFCVCWFQQMGWWVP